MEERQWSLVVNRLKRPTTTNGLNDASSSFALRLPGSALYTVLRTIDGHYFHFSDTRLVTVFARRRRQPMWPSVVDRAERVKSILNELRSAQPCCMTSRADNAAPINAPKQCALFAGQFVNCVLRFG